MSFSPMWTGASGMVAHGERMKNLGNNIANVNTTGFKFSRVQFQNLLSQDLPTGNAISTGFSQIGKGVKVADVITDFRQGFFQQGQDATDLAINGKGFFEVVKDDTVRFTRAGVFRFDKDGYLVDPNGYRVQGRPVEDRSLLQSGNAAGLGSTGDVQLATDADGQFTIPAVATTKITLVTNLGGGDKSTDSADPYFALAKSWNATQSTPLGSSKYDLTNSITAYDENGVARQITFYFDEVSQSNAGGAKYMEFIATMDPESDARYASISGSGARGAGLLMAGVMQFTSTGTLVDISAFTPSGAATSGSSLDLTSWVPASFSSAGYPQFTAQFLSASAGGAAVTSTIAVDFGIKSAGAAWSGGASNAAAIGNSNAQLPSMGTVSNAVFRTTAYDGSSSVLYSTQDGWAKGYLQSLQVDSEGYLNGRFSNGRVAELYRFTLYSFPSENGLRHEGNNLYSASPLSGDPIEGLPKIGSMGSISGDSLERSNVDLATEFVDMIMTQRGFQANAKVITTTDQIIQDALNMKRA